VLNDKKVLESLAGLSLTLAISRTPYIGMPIAANIEKYCANDITNCTSPMPVGPKIRAAYGKLISGNNILVKESNIL
jgi:hypothetical protein